MRKSKRNCAEVAKLCVDKVFFPFTIFLFYRVFHVPVQPITCMATTRLPMESELMGERRIIIMMVKKGDLSQFFTTSLIAKDSQFLPKAAESKSLNS
jgi:hypothetical protein